MATAASLVPNFMDRAKAGINNPGSSAPITPGFNGGKTQTNTQSTWNPGVWYFINFIKGGGPLQYLQPPTDPNAPKQPILELDANGYPTSIVASSNPGCIFGMTIPRSDVYTGQWVLKWDGTGTASTLNFTTSGVTTTSNRVVFTNANADGNSPWTSCFITITATAAAPNNLKNLRLCRIGDEAAMDAGAVWFPEHLALMKSAKPGAIRSLGWGGIFNGTNSAHVGLWSQRKPKTYITYFGAILNPNWFGGTTTNSGSDYTLAYGGFSLTDKVAVQLIWNATTPHLNRTTLSWSTTNGVAININWPAHGLAVGNTVTPGQTGGPPSPPPGLNSAQIYFINNVIDANNFTVSATSGGASVLATATAGPTNMFITSIPRININGTGFVPILDNAPIVPNNILGNSQQPSVGLASIIYDATTGYFWAQVGDGDPGLTVGSPPEVFIDYCAAIGANPWMTAPFMTQTTGGALGGVTDFMTSWVTYAKNNYPWMKPLIEPYNECWNSTNGTTYATQLSYTLWPSFILSNFPVAEAYGKWVSDLGQAMSAIYGNDRTKYSMLSMGQVVGWHNSASVNVNDSRLTSALYVSQNSGQPAYKFCDRVGAATYYNPYDQVVGVNSIINGFNYSVTNAGNPSGQSAIAEAYAATCANPIDQFPDLAAIKTCFTNIKAWGLGLNGTSTVPNAAGGNTVKGICAYEGGFGPDNGLGNFFTSVATAAGSITNANPCVLTLNTNSTGGKEAFNQVGNPGVVGEMINLQFVSGMVQINNTTINCTFTSGSASIAATNSLIANQAVMFVNNPPSPFVVNIPYFVLSTGLSVAAFQLSATKAGTAIVAGSNGTSNGAQGGWFITAVGASTITLDLDSTGFGAWTNASGGLVTWTGSGVYFDNLNRAAAGTNAMGTNNTQMYTDFFGLGGGGFTAEYPSNFLYFGNSGNWSVLYPTLFAPLTPQWNSIVAAN